MLSICKCETKLSEIKFRAFAEKTRRSQIAVTVLMAAMIEFNKCSEACNYEFLFQRNLPGCPWGSA